MSAESPTKVAVTVSEMARMCGLSRARFYQLVRSGAMPPPVYCLSSRRPIYVQELQQVCLHVRRRNCGIDGRPILFYAKRIAAPTATKTAPRNKTSPADGRIAEITGGLCALGLDVTDRQVEAAMKVVHPDGLPGGDLGGVIRGLFLHMKRRDRDDSRPLVPQHGR